MTQQPTIGRIVHYKLSSKDAESVNQRREDAANYRANPYNPPRVAKKPTGFVVHVGYQVEEGQVLPAMVVGTPESGNADLSVYLNGTDTLWSPEASEGDAPGCWSWPPRA